MALLAPFALIEQRVADPMFRLPLFRIAPSRFGVFSSFLSAIARGGLMFMLIIWLQGIWLPQHGYSFELDAALGRDPHAAADGRNPVRRPALGLPLRPLRRAPVRDRRDVGSALAFVLLALLPVDFSYPQFAAILFLLGLSMGAFASPTGPG